MNEFSNHRNQADRFIELDVLRGVAITTMIIYHILWDLDYFGLIPLNNDIFHSSKIVRPIFFLLVGVTLAIASERKTKKDLLFHGLWIFNLGMFLTAITLLFLPEKPIIFGVLHCIGLSIILSIPLLRFKSYNILIATLIILIGLFLYPVESPTILHLVIGLRQAGIWRHTIDYFPLVPWFGVTLLGIVVGNLLYKDSERQFHFPDIAHYKSVSMISWLGRRSLVIYLLHQPVIAGCLFIFLIL